MAKLPITVVVPVRNEEANLASCLERLGDFAEVVVVDSGSVDRTPDIARQSGATLINFEWNGHFPKKRNWVLQTFDFSTDWVLFLDADERISKQFIDEVAMKVAAEGVSGYWIDYTNYFLGRRLRHGVPQRKMALFRVGSGFYERIDESRWSHLDMEVHEHPLINGRCGTIKAAVDHQDYKGLEAYIARHNAYSSWESARYLAIASPLDAKLTRRQRLKYRLISKAWYAPAYFFYTYIVRLGILDGREGLSFALFKLFYFFSIRQKIIEEQKRSNLNGSADQSRA